MNLKQTEAISVTTKRMRVNPRASGVQTLAKVKPTIKVRLGIRIIKSNLFGELLG